MSSRLNIHSGLLNRTPMVKAFGVLLLSGLAFGLPAFGDCVPSGQPDTGVVEKVFDGDTVKLADGRHVRILGVNAPEIDHGKKKDGQPLGEEAKALTESLIPPKTKVMLYFDVERVDHYQRTLAHIYTADKISVAGELLRKGMGFHAAVPPNLSLNSCLADQEKIARQKNLGVWKAWVPKSPSSLKAGEGGFMRIRGKVIKVRDEQSVWLDLDGGLSVKITPTDQRNFPKTAWTQWQGKMIEVRGWVTPNKSQGKKAKSSSLDVDFVLQPRIPQNLELL